jgi:hypothetical protein
MDEFTNRLHVRMRSQPAVGEAASFLQSRWKNLYPDIKKTKNFSLKPLPAPIQSEFCSVFGHVIFSRPRTGATVLFPGGSKKNRVLYY